MNNRVPPLWVWISSFSLFGVFLIFSFFLPSRPNPNYFHSERLLRFQSADSSHQLIKIVLLGSSLARSAFYFDEEMEEFCKTHGHPNIRFIRITQPTAKIESFRKIYNELEAARPDYILIETTMDNYIFTPRNNRMQKFNGKIRNTYFSLLRSMGLSFFVPRKGHNEKQFDQEEAIREKIYSKQSRLERLSHLNKKVKLNPRPFANEDLLFFKKIKDEGGEIVLLEIPRSEVASKQFDSQTLKNARLLNSRVQQENDLLYWKNLKPMTLSHYSDYAHLSPRGREKYCLWFLDQLESAQKTRKQK
jgi:hypothetical protein